MEASQGARRRLLSCEGERSILRTLTENLKSHRGLSDIPVMKGTAALVPCLVCVTW